MNKVKNTLTRLLATLWLLAYVAVSGVQIHRDIHPSSKKQVASGNFEIAALLPSHAPAAETGGKVLKTIGDFILTEPGWCLGTEVVTIIGKSGYVPAAKPLLIRLLQASISINAP